MTFRLDSRCLDILRLLLACDEPVSAASLAAQLGISPRMVRSSLIPAERWLTESEVRLKSVPGIGLSLAGTPESKARLGRLLRDVDHPALWLGPSERLYVLLLTLFFSDTPPQIKQLEETLNLSRGTTLRVMDSAGEWLRAHHLSLLRKQNYGSHIEGDERLWREALLDLLRECAGDARLLARLQGLNTVVDASLPIKSGLEQALQQAWDHLDLFTVRAALCMPEQEFTRLLSDREYIDLFVRLAILVYRNRLGRVIASPTPQDAAPAPQSAMVRQLSDCLHKQYGILLAAGEIGWLESHLPDTNALLHPAASSPDSIKERRLASIRRVVDGMLADASLALHPSLSADIDLDLNLTTRLLSMFEPGPHPQEVSAALLQNIKSQYPYVYSTARESSQRVPENLGRALDDNEIGEIAACLVAAMERLRRSDHLTRKVLVVCSEGAVTAWLLVSRLRAEFPGVEVVAVISALELEARTGLDDIDFIVSTIPVKVKNIPSRQVNPLLPLSDCRALKELFERPVEAGAGDPLMEPSPIHLKDLLTADAIELGVSARTWQEVVDKAGARMVQAGVIENRFVEAMKNVIVEHGPYMVIWPGVVLLHAPPHGIRQLSMGLITLREPVCFGHPQNDPVRVAIVLAATGSRAHITALLELNRMLQDESARSAIGSTVHKSVVLHWISNFSK